MRALFTTLLLVLTALAAPAAAQVQGGYRLVRINGQPLPTPSPTEDGVTVQRASFVFQADGRFSMQARSHEDGEDYEYSEGSEGVFRVRGDSLLLTVDDDDEPISFRWTLDRDTLRLYSTEGHDYSLVPAPVASAEQLQGSYRLMRINGQPVPAPSPSEETVRIESLTMVLGPDSRYAMQVRAHQVAENTPIALDVSGAWRVEGDGLLLEPDESEAEAGAAEFRWTLEGDALLLVDEIDDEYTFARQ